MLRVRRGEFRKENVLRAHNGLTVDNSRAAKTRLPEGQVEDMMQTKRNQSTFTATKEECAEVARRLNDAAECEDTRLHNRPNKVHDDAGHRAENHTNNRDKARTAKERERGRELHFIKAIAKLRRHETRDDTRENAHLQSDDTENRSYRAFLNAGINGAVGVNRAVEPQEDVNRRQKNKIENCCAENCDTFFLLRHAERDS